MCSYEKNGELEKSNVFARRDNACCCGFSRYVLGSVNIRYLADIAFIAVLFGTLIIINLYSAVPDNQKALKFTAYIIFTLILYVSAFVGFLTVFENERYSNFSILS